MHEEITQGCVPNKRDVAVNQSTAAATGSLRTSTGAASETPLLTGIIHLPPVSFAGIMPSDSDRCGQGNWAHRPYPNRLF